MVPTVVFPSSPAPKLQKGPPFSLLNYPINNIRSTNNRGLSLEVGPLWLPTFIFIMDVQQTGSVIY